MEGSRGELLDGKSDSGRRCGRCGGGRCDWRRMVCIVNVNIAGSGGKDGVVFAHRYVGAWVPRGATLPVDDLTGIDKLTCEMNKESARDEPRGISEHATSGWGQRTEAHGKD